MLTPELPVQVAGLTKLYESRVAVDALSFEVEPGEILGLVGPNGAGKTTTIRALTGILPPTSGTIRIAGHDIVDDPIAAKRRLALIPDDPALFDGLTVREHIEFSAQVYGVEDGVSRGEALLEEFDLADRLRTVVDELSRGMRQKVAIACALLHDPAALFLDEPLTGLDPHAIRKLYAALRERAANGTGIVVSSHLLSEIGSLCSRVLIIRAGRALHRGTIEEIRGQLDLGESATLEEIYFRATEGAAAAEAESRPE